MFPTPRCASRTVNPSPRCTMDQRSRPCTFTLSLPANDCDVYRAAVRILRRVMRRAAPDVPTLLRSKLLRQDPVGLADDYLDQVNWPHSGRQPVLRQPPTAPSRPRAKPRAASPSIPRPLVRAQPPADLTRN